MSQTILKRNAVPIYGFLSLIKSQMQPGESFEDKKILDCGAGGSLPPLILFCEQGFQTWGIDISEKNLQEAQGFCSQIGSRINLQKGDMREIPFEDETFDFIYENYSMCHLTKPDTFKAVSEMRRVLKKGGLCMLGVMSERTWPRSIFGREKNPGEYWCSDENGVCAPHTFFNDREVRRMFEDWEIVHKEEIVRYLHDEAIKTSQQEWDTLYREYPGLINPETWQIKYTQRTEFFRYIHMYFFLRKI